MLNEYQKDAVRDCDLYLTNVELPTYTDLANELAYMLRQINSGTRHFSTSTATTTLNKSMGKL